MKNILLLLFIISFTQTYSQLQITQNLTPIQYVNHIVGGGVVVSNVTYAGDSIAIGKFVMNGSSNLELDSGVLLTTGNASDVYGNSSSFASVNNSGLSDPQLDSLLTVSTFNASVLEFDFIPFSDTIRINYVFGSEEYPEFSLSNFSDVIGMFISGNNPNGTDYLNSNIALVPGTDTLVGVKTINNGNGGSGPCINCSYYINNSSGINIAFDGLTTVLTAWAVVTPCASYHFKIVIADASDAYYDSGVFIEAGSFNSKGIKSLEICNVGIDTNFKYNQISWSYLDSSIVDSFYVYRETSVGGVYNFIGSLPFEFNTEYIDSSSNPNEYSYRYKISTLVNCNLETTKSAAHQTMLLNISAGINNEWSLDWTASEGAAKYAYRIYRGTDSLNLQLLTQVMPNVTSYSDTNPPTGKIYYRVEAVLYYPCYLDSTNQSVIRCFSNMVSDSLDLNSGIVHEAEENNSLQIYPNPNNGSFTIEVNTNKRKPYQIFNIEIYNTLGKLVYQEDVKAYLNLKKSINADYLSKGVYFIRLNTDDAVLNSRFVLE